MADAKFTPGPWVAISRGSYGPDGEEADVHVQAWWDVNGPLDDTNFMRGSYCIADAHLIAAAPELYEALETCLAHLVRSTQLGARGYEDDIIRIRAILAKARGEAA